MSETKETAATRAGANPQTVQVHTRFSRDELDAMRAETGAVADATAVTCYVRKNLAAQKRKEARSESVD